MLERKYFALHADSNRCAVATDAETVEIWRLPTDSADEPPETPGATIESGHSPVRGVAFLSPRRVLTVHQLGECVVWRLPEPRELPADQSDGSNASTGDLPATPGADPDEMPADPPAEAETAEGGSGPQRPDVPSAEEKSTTKIGFEVAEVLARTGEGGSADRIAIGGRDGSLVVADADSSREEGLAFGLADAHDSEITSLAFAPRSERLATGARDNRIGIWSSDPSDFEPRSSSADGSNSDTSGSSERPREDRQERGADPDGGEESAALTQELDAPRIPRRLLLEGSRGWPLAIEFSRDGTRIASTALDNSLYLWDPRADEPLQGSVNRHDNWVTQLAWAPDDSQIATGSWDTSVALYRARDLAARYRLEIHRDFISEIVFLEDPPRLISASYDGSLGIWDWSSGELDGHIRAHADWIEALVPLGGNRVLTVSSEDVLRIWDVERAEQLLELGETEFEGFDLGREVDFSDYVDVPDLSSDELGDGSEVRTGLDPVQPLSESDPDGAAEGESAVGLLEQAVETSLQDKPTPELGEGASEKSRELLESRTDRKGEESASTAESASTQAGEAASRLPEPDAAEDADPAASGELEEAFSEISEVALDELETAGEQAGGDGADSREEAPEESVDQLGESIDERVDDTSLGIPDDLGAGSGSGPAGEVEETTPQQSPPAGGAPEPDGSPQPGSPVDETRETSGAVGAGDTDDETGGSEGESVGEPPLSRGDSSGASDGSERSDLRGDTLIGVSNEDAGAPRVGVGAGSSSDSEHPDRTEPDRSERADSAEGSESDAETESADDSEPSAEDLKEKFRKLKDSGSEPPSDSE